MIKVDFMIAGTQKGGTSALNAVLRNHPDLVMCNVKEPHFFDAEEPFAGEPDYTAYHARFPERGTAKLMGEATPDYLFWPPAMGRIHAYNPAMRFIVLLRHPADRAFSQWMMATNRRREARSFEEAVEDDIARLRGEGRYGRNDKAYVARGLYTMQLKRILSLFPASQLHLIKSERFRTDAAPVLIGICDFLGIRRATPDRQPGLFANTYTETMGPAVRERLLAFYADEVGRIERTTGWDCADWRV